MDEATHKKWWPLHYRKVLGEPLTAEEQAVYEAGIQLLDAEEARDFRKGEAQRMPQQQQQWRALKAEHEELRAQCQALRARIAELEAAGLAEL